MFASILAFHIVVAFLSLIVTPLYLFNKTALKKISAITSVAGTVTSGIALLLLGGSTMHVCVSLGIYAGILTVIAKAIARVSPGLRRRTNVLD